MYFYCKTPWRWSQEWSKLHSWTSSKMCICWCLRKYTDLETEGKLHIGYTVPVCVFFLQHCVPHENVRGAVVKFWALLPTAVDFSSWSDMPPGNDTLYLYICLPHKDTLRHQTCRRACVVTCQQHDRLSGDVWLVDCRVDYRSFACSFLNMATLSIYSINESDDAHAWCTAGAMTCGTAEEKKEAAVRFRWLCAVTCSWQVAGSAPWPVC